MFSSIFGPGLQRKSGVLVLLLSVALGGQVLFAQELRVALGTYNSAPYSFGGSDQAVRGLIADLSSYIARELGFGIIWVKVDAPTMLHEFESGSIDVIPLANPSWSGADKSYSVPLFAEKNIVVTRGDNVRSIEKASDLDGLRVGTIYGFSYSGLDQRFKFGLCTRIDFDTLSGAVRALEEGQIDAVIGSDIQILYIIKENRLGSRIFVSPWVESVVSLRWEIRDGCGVSVSMVNKVISKLKSLGKIDSLLSSYR